VTGLDILTFWFVVLSSPAVLEELVNTGRLKGSVVGGRQDKAVYIPDIYTKTQNSWVDSFLQQNGYLGMSFFLNHHNESRLLMPTAMIDGSL